MGIYVSLHPCGIHLMCLILSRLAASLSKHAVSLLEFISNSDYRNSNPASFPSIPGL